jgi:hypothetical protein
MSNLTKVEVEAKDKIENFILPTSFIQLPT